MDQTSFGNTPAYSGDSTQLTYLRSRYYASGTGRFLTRDIWEGAANNPLSFNRWNYGESNPILFTDPTGNIPCVSFNNWNQKGVRQRVDEAERYVDHTSNPIDTYVAAGIAIQCAAWPFNRDPDDSGEGVVQITDNQTSTVYGILIGSRDDPRGHGLKCFIPIGARDDGSCSFCKTPEEIEKMNEQDRKTFETSYVLEDTHDPTDKKWAAIYMKRRIEVVANDCKKCSVTDIYIIAALAQNGSGFTRLNMEYLPGKNFGSNKNDVTIDWKKYFDLPNNSDDTNIQLDRFALVVNELRRRRWIVPFVNTDYINFLRGIGD